MSTETIDVEQPRLIPTPQYILPHSEKQVAIFEVTAPLGPAPSKGIDWRKYLDGAFFTTLLVVGLIIVFTTSSIDALIDFGSMFFDGGLTPLLISTWTIVTGATMFRKRNIIKICASAVLLVTGIVLLKTQQDVSVTSIGYSLFEIGALFFISKFFFLVEDSELWIERLERQLEEAKRSPGVGMAMSYFYNFIVPTAANLRTKEEGDTPIDMEVGKGQFQEYMLKHNELFVFVPRDLDGSDMKLFLRNISTDKSVIQGKPKERPGKGTHRPMFVYFLHWDPEQKICDGLFDIPTIISSCWDRAQDRIELREEIDREIIDFQNQLITLVNVHPLTRGKVRIVSLPPLPFNLATIKSTVEKLQNQ